LCVWHVKRAWLKNLRTKVANFLARRDLMKEASDVLECTVLAEAQQKFEALLQRWARAPSVAPPPAPVADVQRRRAGARAQAQKEPAFVQYLREHWEKKLPLWVKGGLEDVHHSGIFTNAHIESYHMVLKAFDLKGKKRLASRTLPWLIVNLTTTVVGRYWCAHRRPPLGWRRPRGGTGRA